MSALPWWNDKLLGFDLETTGVSPHDDRIVTAALVYVAGILPPKPYRWVVDPGMPIPEGAARIHGWTTERVAAYDGTTTPKQALEDIIAKLAFTMSKGIPVVAMNAAYDLTMLEAEAERHGVAPLSYRLRDGIRPVLDPMVLDKQVSRRKGKRQLTHLCEHYNVVLGLDDAHSSDYDALAACRLIPAIVNRAPSLQAYDLQQLHDAQVIWRDEQQSSLADYFRRQGKHDAAASCNGGWPVQTLQPA